MRHLEAEDNIFHANFNNLCCPGHVLNCPAASLSAGIIPGVEVTTIWVKALGGQELVRVPGGRDYGPNKADEDLTHH